MKQQPDKPSHVDWNWMQIATLATEIGFSIAIPLAIFIGAGLLMDAWLNTRPLFTLLGTLIGMFSSGYTFYRTMSKMLKLSKTKAYTPKPAPVPDRSSGIFSDDADLADDPRDVFAPAAADGKPELHVYREGEVRLADERERGEDSEHDPFSLPQARPTGKRTHGQGR